MKIAVWHNLPSGGGKRALYYHVRGLVERGHEVASWSFQTADHSYLPLSEFATEHIVSLRVEDISDEQTKGDLSEYYRAVNEMRAFDEASRRCAREIEKGGFDLLFANTAFPYHVPFIVRHVQLPRVLYLQEPCRSLYESMPILPWVAGADENLARADSFSPGQMKTDYAQLQALRMQAKQEWTNIRACDEILVNSYFSRESVRRAYGVDSKLCYLGIDTDLFRDLGLERERIIVGLGAFDKLKGVDLAIKATALLTPRPRLLWISNATNTAYKEEMIRLAGSLNVDFSVKEGISNSELVMILNSAALFFYTSRLEPFGFAPLEANACGLPVVAVAEGGIRETIKDGFNGILTQPEPAAIANAADRLLRNPDLARRMSKQAAAHVQEVWNLEGCVDRLEEALLNIVSPQSNAAKLSEGKIMSKSKKAACTIIAKNYLAYARTLAQSFLSAHPDYEFYVLIVDEFQGYVEPSKESFEIVNLTDLEIPNLPGFCFKYNTVELCTAAKPFLIDYLIKQGIDKLLYLDPDILVTAPLTALYEKLETSDIILTPHLDTDYPDDDLLPNLAYILKAGTFNLGFIGLNSSENAGSFLNWWKGKLYNDCVVDVANGYFVDQKFIDSVPIFFENIFVEKDTGYNAAYWNLHSREISKSNETWLCNGKPLYFFHFSGYVLESAKISKYFPADRARHHLSDRPDLQQLFEEYEKLIVKNGYKTASKWNYTFATFKSGEIIPAELRTEYRQNFSNQQSYGNPFTSKRLIAKAEGTQPQTDKPILRNTLLTAEEQLDNILNSRAWNWVSRLGRLKERFFNPVYNFFRRS